MNYACPHCHELLSNDPASGMPPAMCTRCGGDTQASPANAARPAIPAGPPAARSLASFLRWNKTGPGAAATPGIANESVTVAPTGPMEAQQEDSPRAPQTRVQDEPTGADAEPNELPRDGAASVLAEVSMESDTADATSEPIREIEEEEPASVLTSLELADGLDTDEPGAAPRTEAPPPNDAPAPLAASPAMLAEHEATPSFTFAPRESGDASRTPAWQWAALVVLALALVLQILLADRARLATDAQWRPLLESLCGMFGCSLPTWDEPDAFTMLSRDVRPSPQIPGALLVQATFRNDARWNQQWPVMRLSLSDADGRVVGTRAFVPSEYLEPAVTQTTLAPGQSAQFMLQVREPQASVVAFSFDFD